MPDTLKIKIIDKATHAAVVVEGQQVALSTPSVVELPIARARVKSLVRQGNDLTITTTDGEVIVVRGVFTNAQPGYIDLVLQGEDGQWYLADLSSLGAAPEGVISLSADNIESVFPYLAPNSDIATQYLASQAGGIGAWLAVPLGLAGVGAAAALSSGGGGGSDSSKSSLTISSITAHPDGVITVAGKAAPGSTVKVTFPDQTTGEMTVKDDGGYAVTSQTPQTSGQVQVTATDPAGNTATADAVYTDPGTNPSDIPEASFTSIDPDTGTSSSDFITNATALTFKGALGAALGTTQKLQMKVDSGAWQDVPEDAINDTDWSYAPSALSEGSHTVQVRVFDTSDNQTGAASAPKTVVIDTAVPEETVTINPDSVDGKAFSGTLSVPLNAGGGSIEHLEISTDGTSWQTVPVTGTDWSYTLGTALVDGDTLQARVVDAAGNASDPVTETVTVTGGAGTPPAPTQTAALTAISSDTGESGSDFITKEADLTFSGTISGAALTAGQEVQISLNGGGSWQAATVGADGQTWTYDAGTLTDGNYLVQVQVFDSNTSQTGAASAPKTVVIDTAVPEETVTINPDSVDGKAFSGTLSVPLNAGGGSIEHLEISTDGTSWQTVPVTGTDWSYTLGTALVDGDTLQARVVDAAGNEGTVAEQEVQVGGAGVPLEKAVMKLSDILYDEPASLPDPGPAGAGQPTGLNPYLDGSTAADLLMSQGLDVI